MDLKQLEYIVKIAEENNITYAAEKLHITQSALNQRLLNLEKELGVQLFKRTKNKWKLTETGKIYVTNARKILKLKNDTYNEIYDQIENKRGVLTIGLTAGRGIDMFSSIYGKLIGKFPNVDIKPIELSVYEQLEALKKGELDLGFVTIADNQMTDDDYVILYKEEMVFAFSKDHPFKYSNFKDKTIDISDVEGIPLVIMDKNSTNRDVLEVFFKKKSFNPEILFETRYTSSIVSVIESSVCCGFVPKYYAKVNKDTISYFRVKDAPKWNVAVTYKKESYLSKPAKEFIRLTKEYSEELGLGK